MKATFISLTGLAFLSAFFTISFKRVHNFTNSNSVPAYVEKKNILRCGPDWELMKDWIDAADIPLIAGTGSYQWKISTANDSAQFYFNQGINMYYSFHIIEAMASFKKAARFDHGCGMLQWAQALTYGPNINDFGYAASHDALEASSRAVELSVNRPAKEKMLIAAQAVRYSADSTQTRVKLNQLYVDKMKELYYKYPDDADVAALYADALMLQHPWDLWRTDGTPKPWTPRIREVLEKLLAKTPDHPGANHYYIHVMEPSPYATKALPSADRLGKLTPGLAHTVHMPSHIYLRAGLFGKAVSVNEKAVNSYKTILPLYAPASGADFLYLIHALHMQTNNAMLEGRSAYSVKSASELVNSIPKDYLALPGAMGNYVQYIYMTPVLVDIRFGRWNELLNRPKPEVDRQYANVLHHFGRGIALARQSNFAGASYERDQMLGWMKDSSLKIPFTPFSSALEGATVAERLLSGTIALLEKDFTAAITYFEEASAIEETMVYNEPRDWMLNPRHYLGNALLKAGKWKEAEETFLKDLNNNNENGWALLGLSQSLAGQNKKAKASQVMARFKKAFGKADVRITGPVF